MSIYTMTSSAQGREVAMPMSHVMKISANGQVSIPAETRARWQAERVLVVDLGDRVVMRPMSDDPVGDLRGKYKGRMPSTDELRRLDRAEDDARERRLRRS
jgi:bifunctional DNA-binding transcriptional regulator/antitoxin component of YhaV-PrlF toxin-antitoxin module